MVLCFEVLLHLLVDDEGGARCGHDPEQVGQKTLVKSPHALSSVHGSTEPRDALEVVCVIDNLEPRADDLQRVEDACGDHLGR